MRWRCGCGETGTGEAAAQRHAKVCGQMGAPNTALCQVTLWDQRRHRNAQTRACGEPVVRHGLCGKHADDKERLT